MKKLLTLAILSSMLMSAAMATETVTGDFLNSVYKKIDAKAAPVVNKEKQMREQQQAALELRQKQEAEKRAQLEAKQKAQQELVDKKKKQIQSTKDSFKQQKQELKDLFQVN